MSDPITPFHLAFPVRDLDETRAFYLGVLGCTPGRSSATWTDFSLFGHQLSAHLKPGETPADRAEPAGAGTVDGTAVPIPHFGVVLRMDNWRALAGRLESDTATDWVVRPTIRFAGEPGEQATLFVRDPSGHALEFKGFASLDAVFAS